MTDVTVTASITCVNFVGNEIGDDGARAVAHALKMNTTLTTLDMSGERRHFDI